MTDTTTSVAPPPKKRSLFKRAAWQDAPKKDNEDIFSHSNEFPDMMAAQNNRKSAEKREAEASRQRKASESHDRKRRRISNEGEQAALPKSGSSQQRASRTPSKARSHTPLSPVPSRPPPDSLAARYDTLAKTASSSVPRKESIIVDLGDSDEEADSGYVSKPLDDPALDDEPWKADYTQEIPVRPSKPAPLVIGDDEDEEVEEIESDPILALLQAQARERVAAKARAAAASPEGEAVKAPVAQLFIDPEMENANPLMVKVRIDSTIDKPRLAWCGKEGFSPQMTRNVFFTWKNTRLFDSTTIKRLGIQVDHNGNVTVEGDSNIYDEANIPKIHVQAWTEDLWKQRKREDAAEAAAKKIAAEAPPVVGERTPTPEPAPTVTKIKLVLKAKGKPEGKLTVKPDTTFAHIAAAYKSQLGIDKSQPITLMFDGDRLMPLDTVADHDIEDLTIIEVLLK